MTLNETPSLVAFESQIKKVTSSKHQEELNLMTNILNTYIDGFNLIDSFTLARDNEVEWAWLFLITRSFHSMRCAIQLMIMGYYSQAISLLRTVTEDWFICQDCTGNPKILEAILHNKYTIPDKNHGLTFRKMAERTGNLLTYNNDYNHQSRFTHCSALSLGVLRDLETNKLKAAPSYNTILFLDCCELFVRNALRMSEIMGSFLSKLSEAKATSWGEKANQKCKEAADWLKAIRGKYGDKECWNRQT